MSPKTAAFCSMLGADCAVRHSLFVQDFSKMDGFGNSEFPKRKRRRCSVFFAKRREEEAQVGRVHENRSAESKDRNAAGASDRDELSIEDDDDIEEDLDAMRVRVWCRRCGARTGPYLDEFCICPPA
jgi:hypothetical protein